MRYHRASTALRVLDPNVLRGLYQGFGPTVVASIPASIGFFAIYESAKAQFSNARSVGRLQKVPHSVDYAISSAAAELVACAILNPAQVLKQNAQVIVTACQKPSPQLPQSAAAQVLQIFAKRPSKMWAGYTVLAAAQIPHVCLMFTTYETLKEKWSTYFRVQPKGSAILRDFQASAICGAVAGSFSSFIFVPADIVRLRMRLAIGGTTMTVAGETAGSACLPLVRPKPLAIMKEIVRYEGWKTLFRGSLLNCIATGLSGGVYLGTFETIKMLYNEQVEVITCI